ncbi:MAG: hypothetical protein ACYTGQ_16680, partial [Planctomycetota bacterium]
MWLFVWVTLAFWVGCAGENHNHRAHEDRTPLFYEQTPDEAYKGAEQATEPSVLGTTRENWSAVSIETASGRVPHNPIYFRERGATGNFHWHIAPTRPSPLTREGIDVGYEIGAATSGDRMVFTRADIEDSLLSPVKFHYDIAAAPFEMRYHKPRDIVWTPALPLSPATPSAEIDSGEQEAETEAMEAAALERQPETAPQTVPAKRITPATPAPEAEPAPVEPTPQHRYPWHIKSDAAPATQPQNKPQTKSQAEPEAQSAPKPT